MGNNNLRLTPTQIKIILIALTGFLQTGCRDQVEHAKTLELFDLLLEILE
jgi:hypothetical protein